MNSTLKLLSCIVLCALFFTVNAQERTDPKNQDEELGTISWYRGYDAATKIASLQNKSVLILFQEIPGCATCRNYGHNVLSNPMLAEAIQDLFIPLAIHNNKGGKDRKILEKFGEPTWNNPVVRIINKDGKNIVNRVSGNYSAKGLYNAMIQALKSEKREIPEYVKLLGKELASVNNPSIKETHFKMYCFWTGQKHLGSLDGVISAEPGFMDGHEVVKVKYDSKKISQQQLTNYANKASCSPIPEDKSYRVAHKDEQFYLKQTNYKYLPLSELQKTKINSALGNKQSAEKYLSPKQLTWLKELNKPDVKRVVLYDQKLAQAWKMKE